MGTELMITTVAIFKWTILCPRILAKLVWSNSCLFPKDSAKVLRVRISDLLTDVIDAQLGIRKQFLGFSYSILN